jgi:hypothetical protein
VGVTRRVGMTCVGQVGPTWRACHRRLEREVVVWWLCFRRSSGVICDGGGKMVRWCWGWWER